MSAWAKIEAPLAASVNFADIMYEELLTQKEEAELKLALEAVAQAEQPKMSQPTAEALPEENSDELIARTLQAQYDQQYNNELRRLERHRNGRSKVSITLEKFLREGEAYLEEEPQEQEDEGQELGDWDRFETNAKKLEAIPKCGFKLDEAGEMITKHDPKLCGVRNACRVMSFPPEIHTGDGAGFDMKLSNKVFNQLKTSTRRGRRKHKEQDRHVELATAELGVDGKTSVLLFKMINKRLLEQINGIISTGKEAVILHATSDPSYDGDLANEKLSHRHLPGELPEECAIKVYKTTLNEFKQRDRYIKDDYRFKERFSKQNNNVVINMWAEKEMHNMLRMRKVGIKCPEVVMLKQHVLVMSFIGKDSKAAPKLKDAQLSGQELATAYADIVATMHKLYNEANLVHADLSEYNILWHEGHCWFIDVAQSVEPKHPNALEFLMRDCTNIVTFFNKRQLADIYTKEELFEYITDIEANLQNAALMERIHTRGASVVQATAPSKEFLSEDEEAIDFPFEEAWEMTQKKCGLAATEANLPIAPLIAVAVGDETTAAI